jgi:hypothetical protein
MRGDRRRARVLRAGLDSDQPLLAGESTGAIHGVQPAADIVNELARGAEQLLNQATQLVVQSTA